MIPAAVLRWARGAVGSRVVAVQPMTGGVTDSTYLLSTERGDELVLRWLPGRSAEHRRLAAAEARGCRLMAANDVPAPRLVATQLDFADLPGAANLTSWLPGTVDLTRPSTARVATLARAAVAIHQTPVPDDDRPEDFRLWGPPSPEVPTWTADPGSWRAAFEVLAAGVPLIRSTVIHRDFHPGNLLWQGDALTGVIDWAETAWGPADLDVAHCRSNFVLLWDVDVARDFERDYLQAGGRLVEDRITAAYWQIADIVGFLPSPEQELRDLLRTRTDLSPPALRQRLDLLLRWSLDRLG